MKKFIALMLSIMMVMSLVAVPVMAEDATTSTEDTTTTTSTTPEPNYWLTAATVNDSGTYNESTGKMSGFGTTWYPVLLNEENIAADTSGNLVNNRGVRIHDNMGGTAVEANLNSVYVYDADTAAEGTIAWEGFKVEADREFSISNLNKGSFGAHAKGIAISSNADFKGADIRVDSVRFKMPAVDEDAVVDGYTPVTLLFGYDNANWFNMTALQKPALRIMNGGAYVQDISDADTAYEVFIADGTMAADTWYRAERIIDTRIDSGVSGTDTENWQRYIVYDDATGAVIGSSKWVQTCTTSASASTLNSGSYSTYPFANTAYSAINYPAGSYVYFDDFKAWALSAPSSDYKVGDLTGKPKHLEFPMEHSEGTERQNYSLGMSTYDNYYYAGNGVEGNHSTEVTNYKTAAHGSKYIYMQQDIMIPEVNTTSFGLMDVTRQTSVVRGGSTPTASPIKVENGTIKVYGWNTKSSATNKFESVVNDATNDGEFAVVLEPGKWYTVQLKIDQSAYSDTMGSYGWASGSANNTYVYVLNEDGEKVRLTADDTTKAVVTITDSDNNVYTTEEFTFRNPDSYFYYGTFYSIFWADVTMTGGTSGGGPTTNAITGMKVNLDNQKMTLSNSTIDAEDAWVVYEEDFEDQTIGQTWPEFVLDQFNPKKESNITGLSTLLDANDLAAVTVDKVNCVDIPTSAEITLGEDINASTTANTVKLYQGTTDVSGLLSSAVYDNSANTLVVGFSALEPMTSYTISIDRAATEIDDNIFALLPGDTGATATYNFTTGYSATQPFKFTPAFNYPIMGGADITTMGNAILPYDIASTTSTLESYNESPSSYVVIAALYDADGRMQDIMAQTGTIDSSTPVTVDFGGDTLVPTAETAQLRAFVWNAWSLMTPKAGAPYVYPAE